MPTYDNATTGETEVMMNSPPIRILTPRLVLRAARAEDARILFDEYTGNVPASEFLPRGPHASQATTEKLISAWGETTWGKTSRFFWTIVDRRANRPIGIFLMFIPDDETAEIHYGLGPAFWDMASQARLAPRSCNGSASNQHYPKSAQCAQQTATQAAAFWKR
jgi:ribosomal-protein-alanine N-acetyltransferase